MLDSPEFSALEKTYKSDNKKVIFSKLAKRKITGGYRTVQQARDAVAKDLFRSRHDPILKDLREKIKVEKEKSLVDPLTGLYNRRHLGYETINPTGIGELQREFQEARRDKHDLSVTMIDIDDFKQYNDTYGHTEGDRALQTVANVIKKIVRETDIPFRYGGEEFLILSPEAGVDEVKNLSKRLNEEIEKITGLKRKITVSIGTASYHNSASYYKRVFNTQIKNPDDLVRKADDALYYSKLKGKNQAKSANDLTVEEYKEIQRFRQKESVEK